MKKTLLVTGLLLTCAFVSSASGAVDFAALVEQARQNKSKLAHAAETLRAAAEKYPPGAAVTEAVQAEIDQAKASYETEAKKVRDILKELDAAAHSGTGTAADKEKHQKALADLAVTAFCIAQPPYCAVAGLVAQFLGVLGSTEERDQFLGSVESLGAQKPLDQAQIEALGRITEKNWPKLTNHLPEVLGAFQDLPSGREFQEELKKRLKGLEGNAKTARDVAVDRITDGAKITVEMLNKAKADAKRSINRRFSDPEERAEFIKEICALGVPRAEAEQIAASIDSNTR